MSISSRALTRSLALACVLAPVLHAGSASAATNSFGCRASVSAVRPTTSLPALEPYVANRAETPCVTQSAGASSGTTGTAAPGTVATGGPAGAYTYSTASADVTTGAVAPGATALASTDGGTLTGTGAVVDVAGPAQAQASYACVNGQVAPSGSSDVTAAVVNGQTVRPSSPGAEQTTQLGGGSYVTINQRVETATSLTERLAYLHIEGVGDYVLGEAQVVLASNDPCAGTSGSGGSGATGTGGTGGLLNACPAGSVLISSAQRCEIIDAGGAIDVSRPFEGPTGGRVIALSVARREFHSACLYGPGPAFAVVGTNRADRITGTTGADRILGLGGNDRLAGVAGKDCLDGGAGNDLVYGGAGNNRIYGGTGNDRMFGTGGSSYVNGGAGNDRIFMRNGNDRIYGGPGNDRISVGRGRDRIWGGAGNDSITTGDGDDWVWGQGGRDRITVGDGRDHLFGGAGNDRLYGPGLQVYLNGGAGHDLAYVSTNGVHYALAHGCETVRKIRVRRV
jgi:Ca2+-binding RTX toxin-like protein